MIMLFTFVIVLPFPIFIRLLLSRRIKASNNVHIRVSKSIFKIIGSSQSLLVVLCRLMTIAQFNSVFVATKRLCDKTLQWLVAYIFRAEYYTKLSMQNLFCSEN
jgi:hypothetical protein